MINAIATLTCVLASAAMAAAADPWLDRTSPAMTSEERQVYRKLAGDAERDGFRRAFWNGKSMTEAEYLERVAHADRAYGSGREGSGANTDQGRMYIASGPPTAVHRLPSSRIFVACEVWQYESLPGTGYRSRVQFLFYRKAAAGDYRLYWPGLHTIRDLLIPQPGTRSMFPVNDVISANDIRDRLHYAPGEEEIVEAAIGVARGVTGSENGTILARAVSISSMVHAGQGSRPAVASKFAMVDAPEIQTLQFRAGEVPVLDVQVRAKAAGSIGMTLETESGKPVEQSQVPLSLTATQHVHYTQRFFVPEGRYRLVVDVDGNRTVRQILVAVPTGGGILGEGIEIHPGDRKIAILPDPRSEDAIATVRDRNMLLARGH